MTRILYHGTAAVFDRFDETSIGRGTDPNATLGVFFADYPDQAAVYAEIAEERDEVVSSPQILVVAAEVLDTWWWEQDIGTFLGNDENFGKAQFAALRHQLLEAGYHAVECDTGEEAITVILDPQRLTILDHLSIEESYALREAMDEIDIQEARRNDLDWITTMIQEIRNRSAPSVSMDF